MGIFISIVIILMYFTTMLAGWKRGFIKQGIYYIGLVLGILVTSLMGAFLSNVIREFAITTLHINSTVALFIFGWLIKGLTFALIFMLCRMVLKALMGKTEKETVDKAVGCIFGFLKCTLLIWLLNTLLSKVDVFAGANAFLAQSQVYEWVCFVNPVKYLFGTI